MRKTIEDSETGQGKRKGGRPLGSKNKAPLNRRGPGLRTGTGQTIPTTLLISTTLKEYTIYSDNTKQAIYRAASRNVVTICNNNKCLNCISYNILCTIVLYSSVYALYTRLKIKCI